MSTRSGAGWPDLRPPARADGDVIPRALAAEVERAWAGVHRGGGAHRADAGQAPAVDGPARPSDISRVFACSPFVSNACARDPAVLGTLAYAPTLALDAPAVAIGGEQDDAAFSIALRRYRRRCMVHLVWWSVTRPDAIAAVLAQTSALADRCLSLAVARAEHELSRRHGAPRDDEGRHLRLLTLAMGKLGARELNFSSDVDLIFLHPGAGETDGRRALSNDEFFTRVAQRAVRYLDEQTAEGFVFRVDTRLRPFGQSGRLVPSLAALEDYLQGHARAWERYAYVRARAITGEPRDRQAVSDLIRPFVYRRYLDYGVLESVREIRGLIETQVRREARSDDLKLGPGGIREIEFVVQTFQVLHGGRDRGLRLTGLLETLRALAERNLLEPSVAAHMREAYLFLRRTENALQMIRDEQVHALPELPLDRARVACHLGWPDWSSLREVLDGVRAAVSREFADAVLQEDARRPADGFAAVCRGELDPGQAAEQLRRAGMADADDVVAQVAALRTSHGYARLTQVARERLDTLLPLLLGMLAREAADGETLRRILAVLEAVGSRSVYFALLAENQLALEHLVRLCRLGPVIARHLVRSPALIDLLIDPQLLSQVPDRERLQEDLATRLAGVEVDDAEQRMDALRLFQQAAVFQVAVGDLLGHLSVSVVSDLLTDVAELLLEQTLTMARRQLSERHGVPRDRDGAEIPFAIIGYGKLGGWELGYGSDLDLVFLHDVAAGSTDGRQALDNTVWFVRLAQRVIHLLSTPTSAGVLYQVDTRLRPSGNAGLLVTSLEAFEDYQRREAWTWEHQALLRARAVAGDAPLRERFQAVRAGILTAPRDSEALRRDVAHMRQRMRRELSVAAPGCFDIKQDSGGLVDLEFLVQYLVLSNAQRVPELLQEHGNVMQLRRLVAAQVLPQARVEPLVEAYYALRRLAHHASLRGEPAVTDLSAAATAAEVVSCAFEELVGAATDGEP
jgi:glutamate-ammonia-ligase adenylyltransferase